MSFYTYILFSQTANKYYIGSTSNIVRRLNEHNSKQSASTKAGVPWKLMFTKEFVLKSDAIKLEYKLKKMKSRRYLEWFITNT
ncbi:MAG TPA: GIY-YIG nuclease family protein [Ignavibacteriaceae bacterium]|nr:GIY-YIG nuclease family protein [Ignavibacteriaceae bacterium]